MAAVLEAQRRHGGKSVELVKYGTSGETTGDFSEVVGYLSAVVLGPKQEKKLSRLIGTPIKKKVEGYSEEEKQFLLKLAQNVVEVGTKGKKTDIPATSSSKLIEKRGVFVTLEKNGILRGCIGSVQARLPLAEAVFEMAYAAAFEDPRFPEVAEAELPDLKYEISVMSPLSQVDDINNIMVGRDGLMIRLDMHSGLLLPQVATENGWARATFLEQTCLKAGLPKKSYKDKRAKIYKFTVEKF